MGAGTGLSEAATHVGGMSPTNLAPRDYSDEPMAFAYGEFLLWREDLPDDPNHRAGLLAAQMQQRYALQIRRAARARFGGIRGYARHTGQNYARVAAVVNGSKSMRLDDIADAIEHLGIVLD